MRLLRFGPAGEERPGILVRGTLALDLGDEIGDFDERFWQERGLSYLRERLDALDGRQDDLVDTSQKRIGAPVAKPHQVICIGLNYSGHAAEAGADVPSEPVVFSKAPNTVIGPNDDVLIPPGSERTDWEVELAVIIGKPARYLRDEAAASEHIAGFAISNDVSERAYQLERGGQWVKGKSCETFNPLGPWLVTADEVPDPQDLSLQLRLNGSLQQDGTTADMVFGVRHLVWYLSQFMVLDAGTVINTGTPAGVGLGQSPPRYLAEGDEMELSITGLGTQRQQVRAAQG
jgi:2,4-didehydro-3-deoxy-L-rhamnonate hydrolase